jgi:hypothetical protein
MTFIAINYSHALLAVLQVSIKSKSPSSEAAAFLKNSTIFTVVRILSNHLCYRSDSSYL